jgi:hypothetical protein
MNCDEARDLLAGYVLEALEPDEHEAVSRHLDACRDCARLAGALAVAAHELPLALDALEAPELPRTIARRVRRATHPPALRRGWLPRGAPARIVVVAIALLVAVAVVAAIRSQQAVADEQNLRERLVRLVGEQSVVFDVVDSPRTSKALLLPRQPGSHAYGKVYVRSDSNDAVAFVNRLPQPPGSLRYTLWLRAGRAVTQAGTFTLHHGFGYLVFRRSEGARPRRAFVTLQRPAAAPHGTVVLEQSP